MKRYFTHMHSKTPHERRQHALQVAGVATALVFAGWVTTFGLRAGSGAGQSAVASGQEAAQTAAAAIANNPYAQNQLMVATSTDYTDY